MEQNVETEKAVEDLSNFIEELKGNFIELPDINEDESPNELEAFYDRFLLNNFKLCQITECFENDAKQIKKECENDPNIELLKKQKEAVEIMDKMTEYVLKNNSELRRELMTLKEKRVEKRYYERMKDYFVEYREKTFPEAMKEMMNLEKIIDDLNKNSTDKIITENDLQRTKDDLQCILKENNQLKSSIGDTEKLRQKIEENEAEICRFQVRIIEMDEDKLNFDEYALKNEIDVLKENIKSFRENKKKSSNDDSLFKNPNDYASLLDFLDRAKRMKNRQMKKDKKRKLEAPKNPQPKRKKNKTGSYSHDKSSRSGQPQSSPYRKSKSKGRIEESGFLKRSSSSTNLGEHSGGNVHAGGRTLRRSPSFYKDLNEESNRTVSRRLSIDERPESEQIHLQRFSSKPLSPEDVANRNAEMLAEFNLKFRKSPSLSKKVSLKEVNVNLTSSQRSMRRRSSSFTAINEHEKKAHSNNREKLSKSQDIEEDELMPLQRFPSKPLFPEDANNSAKRQAAKSFNNVNEREKKNSSKSCEKLSKSQDIEEEEQMPLQRFPSKPLFPEDVDNSVLEEDEQMPLQRFPSKPLFPEDANNSAKKQIAKSFIKVNEREKKTSSNSREKLSKSQDIEEDELMPLQRFPSKPLFPEDVNKSAKEQIASSSKSASLTPTGVRQNLRSSSRQSPAVNKEKEQPKTTTKKSPKDNAAIKDKKAEKNSKTAGDKTGNGNKSPKDVAAKECGAAMNKTAEKDPSKTEESTTTKNIKTVNNDKAGNGNTTSEDVGAKENAATMNNSAAKESVEQVAVESIPLQTFDSMTSTQEKPNDAHSNNKDKENADIDALFNDNSSIASGEVLNVSLSKSFDEILGFSSGENADNADESFEKLFSNNNTSNDGNFSKDGADFFSFGGKNDGGDDFFGGKNDGGDFFGGNASFKSNDGSGGDFFGSNSPNKSNNEAANDFF